MGKVTFIWWSDLSDCIVKNQNPELLPQMTQKVIDGEVNFRGIIL